MEGAQPRKQNFDQCCEKHQDQERIKKQMKEECQATLAFLAKVELFNSDINKYNTFNLINEDEIQFTDSKTKELTDKD